MKAGHGTKPRKLVPFASSMTWNYLLAFSKSFREPSVPSSETGVEVCADCALMLCLLVACCARKGEVSSLGLYLIRVFLYRVELRLGGGFVSPSYCFEVFVLYGIGRFLVSLIPDVDP